MLLSLSSSNVRSCGLTEHGNEDSAYTYLKKKEVLFHKSYHTTVNYLFILQMLN
jgi:hypothetical protein